MKPFKRYFFVLISISILIFFIHSIKSNYKKKHLKMYSNAITRNITIKKKIGPILLIACYTIIQTWFRSPSSGSFWFWLEKWCRCHKSNRYKSVNEKMSKKVLFVMLYWQKFEKSSIFLFFLSFIAIKGTKWNGSTECAKLS